MRKFVKTGEKISSINLNRTPYRKMTRLLIYLKTIYKQKGNSEQLSIYKYYKI